MAQKDVELRLKARDDASKHVKKVSDALKTIAADADKAAKGAGNTGAALGSLAADVARLQSEASRLKSFGNIAVQLDKSTAAVERSERALKGAQEEFARLAAESKVANAAASNFKIQMDAQAAALAQNKRALADTRTEQTKVNAVVRQAEKDQIALNAARSKRATGNRATAGVGIEAGTPRSSARESMGAFLDADLAQARARQAQINGEVKNYATAVKESSAALKDSKSATKDAAREQKALADRVESAGNALLAARAGAAANWRELEKIDDAASKAGAALGGLATRQEDIARASKRTADQLARTQRALDAYGKFSTGGGEVVSPKTAAALQSQVAVINDLRSDWKALEAETRRLAVGLNSVSGNATAQVDAFNRMAAASRQAKGEYQSQIAVLDALRAKANLPASGLGKVKADASGVTTANTMAADATKKLTAEQMRLAPATQRAGAAMRTVAGNAEQMGGAIRKSYSDKRQALSITQRLRGEVLALATAYLGLNSAIGGISQSIAAFRSLEAVQSRLGAVFQQDTARVASEVDFLRAQADRLGISFASLGEQYGKFAIAASSANFSASNTRDIFLAVAEAGRVNKLSLDQLNGTFLAIEQIISKGKFTSEEVRRQLGDRLPGAFNILADAMGVTTAELDKMMSQGDLLATESNLLKFANEMTRRFGPQLSASLDTVSTDLGRFENNLFKIRLALAQGFIPELRNALQAFNTFANSPEGSRTFAELGATIGRVVRVLAVVPQYFDEIILAAKTFAAIKLAQAFVGIGARALDARRSFVGLAQSMAFIGPQMQQMSLTQRVLGQGFVQTIGAIDSYRARLLASTASTRVARVGTIAFAGTLGGLRTAMMLTGNVARVMWAAIGGIPGIIATGLVFAVGSWMTGIDKATGSLVEHDRQLAALRETYQAVGQEAKNWYESINGVTISQAIRSTEELRKAYDDARKSLEKYSRQAQAWTSDFAADSVEARQAEALTRLSALFADGAMSIEDYTDAIELIANSPANQEIKSVADGLLDIVTGAEEGADSLSDMRKAVEMSEAKLRLMNGAATEADKVLLGLVEAAEQTNTAFSKTEFVTAYTDAIDTLKGKIPELADELKKLKDMTEINTAAWGGMTAAFQAGDYGKIAEIIGLWARAAGAVGLEGLDTEIKGLGSGGGATASLIKQFEGFIPEPKWDKNAYRMGYGSDTVTLSDGSIQKVVQGMTVTRADAERDLARRIVEFQSTVKGQIGEDRFNSFNDAQQAVLTSIAYNYGSLPGRILNAVKSGDAGAISGAIRGLSGDNNGENAKRRNKEALIFERGGNGDAGVLIKGEEDRLKTLQDQAKATQERIAQTDHEIAQQRLINDGKAKQAAIEEAARAARAENPAITEADLAKIREQTALLYEQQNAREGLEKAEERVNQLYQLRQQLLEQQKMKEESGDLSGAAALKTQVEGVNSQLREAIANAIGMWQAIGGPEADAAIAKLQTTGMSLEDNSRKIVAFGLNAQQIGSAVGSFADGMVGILDKMAQAIANGENAFRAMGTAFLQFAADFLRQIAMMILKQMLLNALAGFGGPIGQAAAGLGGIAGHTGGLVGSAAIGGGNRIGQRPAWVQSAFTYHSGGLVGFKPDEVSATLKRNEEVLTEEDPRHRFNLGGGKDSGGGNDRGVKQILVMSEGELANALSTSAGEKVVITHIKRNAATLKQVLK